MSTIGVNVKNLFVLFFILGCNNNPQLMKASSEATRETPHVMECYRVDNDNSPLTVYRCENDETICYTRRFGEAGVDCKFKKESTHE